MSRIPLVVLPGVALLSAAVLIGATQKPRPPAPPRVQVTPLFAPADKCMACHNGLLTFSGQDVSIGYDWRASMMANAARDPYWQASVRREVLDHPAAQAEIEDECSACHMPMARYEARAGGAHGSVFAHLPIGREVTHAALLAADGVSCTACHQITNEKLGSRDSFNAGFVVETDRPIGVRNVYGPFSIDVGRTRIMRSASGFQPTEASHIRGSELCATCHTLYTKALGPDGKEIGELPEQVPYLEWRHSALRTEQSCQDCHMPAVGEPVAISAVLGQARTNVARHEFRGGNFLVPRMLNRYRGDLGVTALPQELDVTSRRNLEHLRDNTAGLAVDSVEIRGDRLVAVVSVENLAGHKFPTAYPSRRAWLHVVVRDGAGKTIFESGAPRDDGRIEGNDNDADPTRYEPHYPEIDAPEKVQVYEAIMVGQNGAVTTGLLTAVRFVKDNRLLPRGFDKATADPDIAVHGEAERDADFKDAGDIVRYSVSLAGAAGPFTVQAALYYQPIGYRWADNLRARRTEEGDRFLGYWKAMAAASRALVATATATAR